MAFQLALINYGHIFMQQDIYCIPTAIFSRNQKETVIEKSNKKRKERKIQAFTEAAYRSKFSQGLQLY